MKLKLSIIGCGRLGKTLAYLFAKTEFVYIQDVINLSMASAERAVAFIGQGRACPAIKQLKPVDVYLIATPDDSIEFIGQQLADQALLVPGSLVFHCSGLLSSECLSSVANLGCYTASLHPAFSFSEPEKDIKNFKGTRCAFEGNKLALQRLMLISTAIGGQLFSIKKEDKALYHTASVLASNYLVTLAAIAEICYTKAGIADKLSKTLTETLMIQVLSKIQSLDKSRDALTGPLQRGDKDTLKKHLAALKSFPDIEYIYRSLGKATLTLTKHDESLKEAIAQLLIDDKT